MILVKLHLNRVNLRFNYFACGIVLILRQFSFKGQYGHLAGFFRENNERLLK